ILDIAQAVGPNCKLEFVGLRPGEKLHEEMITESDSFNTYDCGKYYVVLPTKPIWNKEKYISQFNAKPVTIGFKYNSLENNDWLTVDQARSLIKEHVDPNFRV
ncbi:MAG: polysaccharide biosynthesis protein, partial [Bdellovibrionales bacterium]|nr:polysaccharide biosynthesis protein [Bdellovibrionales bacterium]